MSTDMQAVSAPDLTGLCFVPIPAGTKGPNAQGWNEESHCIPYGQPFPRGYNIGLAHAYSKTMALDIDDLTGAIVWFHARKLDLQALLADPSMVHIDSGRPNRAKLLFKIPQPHRSIKIKSGTQDVLEFRCATRDGLTVQDVLPPSIHPDTGKPYQWSGASIIPEIPGALYTLWLEQAAISTDRAPERPPGTLSCSLEELQAMLDVLDPDMCREDWLNVGMALHEATAGANEGYWLYDGWSSMGAKYNPVDNPWGRWQSFKPTAQGITLATLKRLARARGYGVPKPEDFFTAAAQQQQVETGTENPPQAPLPPFINAGQLCDGNYHVNWIIDKILPADTLGLIIGDSGSFKSFIQIDKALHIASGRPYCGRSVKQGTVFFLAAEGRGGIKRRVAAWCKHHQLDPATLPFYLNTFPLTLNSTEWLQFIEKTMADMATTCGPAVHITIDTLSASAGGLEENSAADMSEFLGHVTRHLRVPTGAGVEMVHHFGKVDKSTARGSAVLRNNVDLDAIVYREEEPEDPAVLRTCLQSGKSKDDEPFGEIWFEMVKVQLDLEASSLVPVWQPGGIQKTEEQKAAIEVERHKESVRRASDMKMSRLISAVAQTAARVRMSGQCSPPGEIWLETSELVDVYMALTQNARNLNQTNDGAGKTACGDVIRMLIPTKGYGAPLRFEGHEVYKDRVGSSARNWTVVVRKTSETPITEVAMSEVKSDDFLG